MNREYVQPSTQQYSRNRFPNFRILDRPFKIWSKIVNRLSTSCARGMSRKKTSRENRPPKISSLWYNHRRRLTRAVKAGRCESSRKGPHAARTMAHHLRAASTRRDPGAFYAVLILCASLVVICSIFYATRPEWQNNMCTSRNVHHKPVQVVTHA